MQAVLRREERLRRIEVEDGRRRTGGRRVHMLKENVFLIWVGRKCNVIDFLVVLDGLKAVLRWVGVGVYVPVLCFSFFKQ